MKTSKRKNVVKKENKAKNEKGKEKIEHANEGWTLPLLLLSFSLLNYFLGCDLFSYEFKALDLIKIEALHV